MEEIDGPPLDMPQTLLRFGRSPDDDPDWVVPILEHEDRPPHVTYFISYAASPYATAPEPDRRFLNWSPAQLMAEYMSYRRRAHRATDLWAFVRRNRTRIVCELGGELASGSSFDSRVQAQVDHWLDVHELGEWRDVKGRPHLEHYRSARLL